MFKLTVFIPNDALEQVKTALFNAGAGSLGNYSHCCWQVQGCGQFKPLAGSNPYIGNPPIGNQHTDNQHTGKQPQIEQVDEWRVEMVVADKHLEPVIDALKLAHPYETPAYDVIQVVDI